MARQLTSTCKPRTSTYRLQHLGVDITHRSARNPWLSNFELRCFPSTTPPRLLVQSPPRRHTLPPSRLYSYYAVICFTLLLHMCPFPSMLCFCSVAVTPATRSRAGALPFGTSYQPHLNTNLALQPRTPPIPDQRYSYCCCHHSYCCHRCCPCCCCCCLVSLCCVRFCFFCARTRNWRDTRGPRRPENWPKTASLMRKVGEKGPLLLLSKALGPREIGGLEI